MFSERLRVFSGRPGVENELMQCSQKSAEPNLGVSVKPRIDISNICMHPESSAQPCRNDVIFRLWCDFRVLKRSSGSRMRVGDLFHQSVVCMMEDLLAYESKCQWSRRL